MIRNLTMFPMLILSAVLVAAPAEQAVLSHYADMAHAKYQDALSTALELQSAVSMLIEQPTEKSMSLKIADNNVNDNHYH